ncbi:uncharacterized protein DS421_14g472910 [Arachis hypogaea]|nr:uncharacterized protein DS421_14g472910 [Arachis hypogaea]
MKMRQSCNSWWGGVGGAGREKTSSGITKPERVKGEKDILPSRAAAGSANAMTQLLTTVYFSDLDVLLWSFDSDEHSSASIAMLRKLASLRSLTIMGLHAFMPEPAQEEIFSLWEQVVVACMKIKEKLVEGENKIKCKMRTLIVSSGENLCWGGLPFRSSARELF